MVALGGGSSQTPTRGLKNTVSEKGLHSTLRGHLTSIYAEGACGFVHRVARSRTRSHEVARGRPRLPSKHFEGGAGELQAAAIARYCNPPNRSVRARALKCIPAYTKEERRYKKWTISLVLEQIKSTVFTMLHRFARKIYPC